MRYKLFDKDPHFYRNVVTLSLPIAAQSLITIGVNMLDNEPRPSFFGEGAAVGHHEYAQYILAVFVECHLLQVITPNATSGRTPEVVEIDDGKRCLRHDGASYSASRILLDRGSI